MWAEPPATLDTQALREWSMELGIDELGVCDAVAYEDAQERIDARLARGLFADLRFTMTRADTSCHPETLLDGAAVSVVSAALCYWHPDAETPDDGQPRGTIARYTRADAYDALRVRLERIAAWLEAHGHRARVLVDSNDHVDREAAIRSGVGFAGKNTVVITRRTGSWVVLGTVVTDASLQATDAIREGCGSCTRCIDACPTDAIVDGGRVLDVTRCISYWGQSRHSIPLDVREAMDDLVYGCDICQDVCPWNRGVEGRRADATPLDGTVRLVDWLERPDAELLADWDRLFVPRRQARFLRRNALVALGNRGSHADAALAAPWLDDADPMLREHAAWALRRIGGPIAAAALARTGA